MTVVELARKFQFVREKTNHNDGKWVEWILFLVGCGKGDPWCAAFVSLVLGIFYEGKSPLVMSASCEAMHKYAKLHKMIVTDPQEGDVFLILIGKNDNSIPEDHAHHTGFCTGHKNAAGRFPTIEGNTNPAGGRDGYGVFERTRTAGPHVIFIRPSLGA